VSKPLNAIAPYFGAKRMQAAGIIEALGDHKAYWEPFCGSLAVLLAKPKTSVEVANDLNGGLINLARVVQHDSLSLYLFDRLWRTLFNQVAYEESAGWCRRALAGEMPWLLTLSGQPRLDWAYHYFVMSWQGRNGLCGTAGEANIGFCKRFTSNGGDPAVRFQAAVESIPTWWDRLRGVTILQQDGVELIWKIEDKQGTVIYCDPPYLDKGAKYLHDFEPEEHEKLAAALRRFEKTRVVVSYYEHPLLDSLYLAHGFRKVEKTTKKQMGNGANKAPEVLLIKN
jgi:DNA adenine methylase